MALTDEAAVVCGALERLAVQVTSAEGTGSSLHFLCERIQDAAQRHDDVRMHNLAEAGRAILEKYRDPGGLKLGATRTALERDALEATEGHGFSFASFMSLALSLGR